MALNSHGLGINVNVGGNATREFGRLGASLKNVTSSTSLATSAFGRNSSVLSSSIPNVNTFQKSMGQLRKGMPLTVAWTDKYGVALGQVTPKFKGAGKQLGIFGKLFKDFGSLLPPGISQLGSFGLKLGAIGVAAYAGFKAISALARGISHTIERAGAFEKGMAEVSTLLNEQQMKMLPALSEEVLDLGVKYGQSMDIMTKATYQAISAGVAFQDVPRFMETAGKLAVGGVTDMETAVDGLTSIMNSWGLSMTEVGLISDQMFVAMRAGKTTIGELARSIGQVAPIAAQMNIPLKEVLSLTATLTKGGLSTSEAITGIRQAMVTAMRQTPMFVKNAKKLGIAYDQATIAEMGFAKWMTMVVKKAEAAGMPVSKFFRNVQGLGAALTAAGKGAKDNAEIMDQMGDSSGTAEEAFRKMTETYEFKSARASAALDKFSIKSGKAFLPLAKAWEDFKTWFFEGLSDAIDSWNFMWDVGWELVWLDLKLSLLKIGQTFDEWADWLGGKVEGVFKAVGIDVKGVAAGIKKTTGLGGFEEAVKGVQAEMAALIEKGYANSMKRRDEEREAAGKDKPQVNVDNKVNIGNKKVHESYQQWEEAFLILNYQGVT